MEKSSAARSSQHRRNNSGHVRRQAILRRSTHDPLDAASDSSSGNNDDSQNGQPQRLPAMSHERIASSGSDISDARRRGIDMSSESISSISNEAPSVSIVERAVESKDFSFIVHPSNFHPLNEQDIPAALRQDARQQQQQAASLQELLDAGFFFTAAQQAAQQLKPPSTLPTDHTRIFSLLYIRLACLQILSLHGVAAQESKCLQDLSAPIYIDEATGKHLVPWRLRVLIVRLQAIGFNDWRKGIMAYYELAREARLAAHRADSSEYPLWQDRLTELGVLVANALVEMGDLEGAVRHVKTLAVDGIGSLERQGINRTRLAILLLRIGDTDAAHHVLSQLAEEAQSGGATSTDESKATIPSKDILAAILSMANGAYEDAIKQWEALLQRADASTTRHDPGQRGMILQNLAVCRIYTGEITYARRTLESILSHSDRASNVAAVEDSPSTDAEPLLAVNRGTTFNLATMYELTSDKSRELKLGMTRTVSALLHSSNSPTTSRTSTDDNAHGDGSIPGTKAGVSIHHNSASSTTAVKDWMNADFKL